MKTAFFLLLAAIFISGTGIFAHSWGRWLAVVYVVILLGAAVYWWPESGNILHPAKPAELTV